MVVPVLVMMSMLSMSKSSLLVLVVEQMDALAVRIRQTYALVVEHVLLLLRTHDNSILVLRVVVRRSLRLPTITQSRCRGLQS